VNSDELMTIAEATQYLGISNKTMARLIREGALPWQHDPLDKRSKLVKRSDVEALKARSKRVA
jgi:excisionase family DNA binding protein